MSISKAFTKFPEEGALVGRILSSYTDVELCLMHCVKAAREDLDTVLKAMYRARGETQRVDIADAFGRQTYRELDLGTQFEMAVGAVRHCMKIRNQYAHCVWWDDGTGELAFTNLEELARVNDFVDDLRGVHIRHVSVALLGAQTDYFDYAESLLIWVLHEGNKKAGRPAIQTLAKPHALTPPALSQP